MAERQVDRSAGEGKAEDVDGVRHDEDEEERGVGRRVGPRVETPAAAGEDQQSVTREEPAASSPEVHEALRPSRVRPVPKPVEPTKVGGSYTS